jgi:probable O-glycosylation ligase (exosortase A-associated)
MKQTVLMVVLLVLGSGGAMIYGPFIGVAVYYLFAVLRPQALWGWALPEVRWSFYVSLATLVSLAVHPAGNANTRAFGATHRTMLAFACWITASHMFALNDFISAIWYTEYVKIVVMFFCASVAVRDLKQIRLLYVVAVGAIGYIAYEMNALYLFDRRLDIYHEGFGGLDNNGAGLMLAMGVPMAYFLWQTYENYWRWLFFAMIPVILHAVFMSFSRGAMLSLLLVWPLMILRTRRRGQILLFLGCLCVLIPTLAGTEIRDRFFSIEKYEEDQSSQARFESWGVAWKIIKDYPVFGVGLRNAPLLLTQYGGSSDFRAIHSQYLQIAADSGLPALALYLWLFLGAWRALRRTQRHCREWTSDDAKCAYNLASGLESGVAIFCVGSIFLSLEVFELPYLLILLAVKLGLVVQAEQKPLARRYPAVATQMLQASELAATSRLHSTPSGQGR